MFSTHERNNIIHIDAAANDLLIDPRTGGERFIGDKELASYFKSAVFIFLI
jgi:hypothetical protein